MNKRILVKPPVREVYLNNKDNEKALYISLPEEYCEYSLRRMLNMEAYSIKTSCN